MHIPANNGGKIEFTFRIKAISNETHSFLPEFSAPSIEIPQKTQTKKTILGGSSTRRKRQRTIEYKENIS